MTRAINVSHITYRAWDVDKCVKFFTDVLGFCEQRRGGIVYVGIGDTWVELGSATAAPGSPPEESEGSPYVFGVAVNDLDETLEAALAGGATVVRPIWSAISFWGRQAAIAPPGGPGIALREWRSPDGPHYTGSGILSEA